MDGELNQSEASVAAILDHLDLMDAQPLLLAIESGDLAEVARLLAGGASPSVFDEDGNGPLHLAVQAGLDLGGIGPLLVECGCDVNTKNDWGETPLHVAVWSGEGFEPDAEAVSTLLALNGLRIDEPNDRGRTALSLAAEGGEFGDRVNGAIVGMLLSRGADPSIVDCEGRAPLDWANGGAVGMLSGVLRKPLLAEPIDGK